MTIGLVVTLAVTSALIRNDGALRGAASLNDIDHAASTAVFAVDRAIRSAGSGFSQSWRSVFGCLLDVSQHGAPLLPPRSETSVDKVLPDPMQVRLAPVVIGKGFADTSTETRGDVLTIMSGTSGMREAATSVDAIDGNVLALPNTLGFRAHDLILLASEATPGGCMVQQVENVIASSGQLVLGGDYYAARGTNHETRDFSRAAVVMQLGGDNNFPQLQRFGVGAHQTLLSHDLLKRAGGDVGVPVAQGVVEMRALYGVNTHQPPGGAVDAWIDPAGSGYGAGFLTDGSVGAKLKLRSIVAVKVGFVMRTPRRQRDDPSPGAPVTLFADVRSASGESLAYTRRFEAGELAVHHAVIEATIPLRNVLMAPP